MRISGVCAPPSSARKPCERRAPSNKFSKGRLLEIKIFYFLRPNRLYCSASSICLLTLRSSSRSASKSSAHSVRSSVLRLKEISFRIRILRNFSPSTEDPISSPLPKPSFDRSIIL